MIPIDSPQFALFGRCPYACKRNMKMANLPGNSLLSAGAAVH